MKKLNITELKDRARRMLTVLLLVAMLISDIAPAIPAFATEDTGIPTEASDDTYTPPAEPSPITEEPVSPPAPANESQPSPEPSINPLPEPSTDPSPSPEVSPSPLPSPEPTVTPEPSPTPTEKPEEIKPKIFNEAAYLNINGVNLSVFVYAPEGVYPEDAQLIVQHVTDENLLAQYRGLVAEARGDYNSYGQYFVDISVVDSTGSPIAPNGEVSISFASLYSKEAIAQMYSLDESNLFYTVYHLNVYEGYAEIMGDEPDKLNVGTYSLSPWCVEIVEFTPDPDLTTFDLTSVDPSTCNHSFDSYIRVAPSCTTMGYDIFECSICGKDKIDNYTNPAGHNYEVTDPAGCGHDGTQKCKVCGVTATIPQLDHVAGEPVVVDATCTTQGTKDFYCKSCNTHLWTEYTPAAHDWESTATTHVDPTCANDGYDVFKCKNCTETNTVVLPATGNHQWILVYNTATCTEDGIMERKCSVCNQDKTEASPATGHNFDPNNWTITKPATCTEEGEKEHQCQNSHHILDEYGIAQSVQCDKKETETIDKLDHDYDPNNNYICKNGCGKTYPEIQELLDILDSLPTSVDGVTKANALQVYNAIEDFNTKSIAVPDNLKTIRDTVVQSHTIFSQLSNLRDTAISLLNFTTFTKEFNPQSFNVLWNDNNSQSNRPSPTDFLNNANVQLSYQVKDSNGNVIKSGALPDKAAADSAFSFLGINANEDLFSIDNNHKITTDSSLPTKYTSTYTDVATGETFSENFTVEYSVTMKNPTPDKYVVTSPDGATQDSITIPAGGSTIFTIYNDYSAEIHWMDDHNSNSTRPTSLNNCKVYQITDNDPTTATLVTSGYDVVLTPDPSKPDYYTVKIAGLPALDNDCNPLTYYITEDPSVPATGAGAIPGDRYNCTYFNVGNYTANENGLYDKGTMTKTLYNTTTFSVNKVWVDTKGNDVSARPNATMSIWSAVIDHSGTTASIDTESAFPVPGTDSRYSVPKAGGNVNFVRYLDGGVTSTLFPMYDEEGRRYVYFSKESSVNGYTTEFDFSNCSNVPADIVNQFSSDSKNVYMLNGTTVKNISDNTVRPELSKSFSALSIQNKENVQSTFLLQVKDSTGSWVNATSNNILDYESSPSASVTCDASKVEVTLKDFSAENNLSSSFDGIIAKKIDENSSTLYEYRWIETNVSVNGVSANYDTDKWQDNGKGLAYIGEVIVKDNQTSSVLGDSTTQTSGANDTTAIFTSSADDSGNFTNRLSGEVQIEARKLWKDENGNNIAGDERVKDAKVTFVVYRDGKPFDKITLSSDDLIKLDEECWQKIMNYDRFDENGREYRYKIGSEGTTVEGLTFLISEDYTTSVVEYPAGSGVLMPRMTSIYTNTIGNPGRSLGFIVEKEWLDDSDLETRNPIQVSLYRVKSADGKTLDNPEIVKDKNGNDITFKLTASNNWLKRIYIAAKDDGNNLDVVTNYVLMEDGIVVNGSLVPIAPGYSSFEALRNQLNSSGSATLGTVGSTNNEGGSWDGLYYIYKATSREEILQNKNFSSTVLSNLRTGEQKFNFCKKWNSGGIVKNAQFALYNRNDMTTPYATFEVSANTNTNTVTATKLSGAAVNLNAGAITQDNGNYSLNVEITGIPKFDGNGVQQEYVIQEIKIQDDKGTWIDVDKGSCKVDDIQYSVSYKTTAEYAKNDQHRSPDVFSATVSNNISGSYKLVANKVWRDTNEEPRPDISFSVYRISTADPAVAAAINTPSALATVLAGKINNGATVVKSDKYWDTKLNDYYWTCEIDNVPRFDANGFPYVYFGVERLNSSATKPYTHVGYYCNAVDGDSGYRPVATGKTTEDVFGKPNSELTPQGGSVFILADGTHSVGGDYSKYYSATAVNRIEGTQKIEGRKLWKMPLNMTADITQLPPVTIELYRLKEEVKFSDYADSTAYAAAIRAKGENIVLGSNIINTFETKGTGLNYTYSFDKDSKDNPLPRYDEYGNLYHYYVLEKSGQNIINFPSDGVQYPDKDYTISNIFKADSPYVEVSVKKTWEIDDKIWTDIQNNSSKQYGLSGNLSAADLAPVTVTLTGVCLDKNGNEISSMKSTFGTKTLDPIKAANGSTTVDDVTYALTNGTGGKTTVTAEYTFKKYINNASGTAVEEYLPYYWIDNQKIKYSLDEKSVNGYAETKTNHTEVIFNSTPETRTDGKFYTTDTAQLPSFNNKYGDFDKITFTKFWDDNYVNNDDYRPDQLVFTIKRKLDGVEDTKWSTEAVMKKVDFKGSYLWKVEVDNLLKYAPNGKAYEYYIDTEAFKDSSGTQIGASASTVNDIIGDYQLTDKTKTSMRNRLKDVTTVESAKKWTLNGVDVTEYENNSTCAGIKNLWDLGALPVSVTYLVQRKANGGAWNYVPASDYADAIHTTTIPGQSGNFLGRKVVLGTAYGAPNFNANSYLAMLNAQCKWVNLPKKAFGSNGYDYEYRVIEILEWADGTTTTLDDVNETSKNVTLNNLNISGDKDNGWKTSLTNDIGTDKVRLAKIWDDRNGSDNTRPPYLQVTIVPLDANGTKLGAGSTFILDATGNYTSNPDSNIYYSTVFNLPKTINKTYGVTGARYEITEVFLDSNKQPMGTTVKNGDTATGLNNAVYTATITSDNGGVVYDNAQNLYTFKLSNKYDTPPKSISVSADKTWNDTDWTAITRPKIQYVLQYKSQAGVWTDFDDATLNNDDDFIVSGRKQSAAVTFDPNVTDFKHTWSNLRKYWEKPKKDGVPEIIEYRVREVLVPIDSVNNNTSNLSGLYTASPSEKYLSWKFEEATNAYDGTNSTTKSNFTNTLKKFDLKLKKTWTPIGGTALSKQQIQYLIDLKAIPETLRFVVEYQLNGSTDWNPVPVYPSNSFKDIQPGYMQVDLYNTNISTTSITTGFKLPRYDKNGNAISYRVREVGVKFQGEGAFTEISWNATTGTLGNISTDSVSVTLPATTATAQSVTAKNNYEYVSVTVTKEWVDEHNRDGKRGDFKIALYRDGELYGYEDLTAKLKDKEFCTVTKNGDTWTIKWDYLPKYKNNSTEESVYTWKEVQTTTNYAKDPAHGDNQLTPDTKETNAYQPQRGEIAVVKKWDDYNNGFDSQPNEIWVKLQFKNKSGSYEDVKIIQDSDFEYVNGKKIYKAADVDKAYAVLGDSTYTTETVTTTGGVWIKLTKSGNSWTSAKWVDVPVYRSVGTKVQYRIVEGQKQSGVITEIAPNTVAGNYKVTYAADVNVVDKGSKNFTVTNKVQTTDLTVTKEWLGELNKLAALTRPQSVTFEIQWKKSNQDETKWASVPANVSNNITIKGGKSYVTVDGRADTTSWGKTVSGLPLKDAFGNTYQYRVIEAYITYSSGEVQVVDNSSQPSPMNGIIAGPYDLTTTTTVADFNTANNTYSVKASNTLRTGSYKVSKNWFDEDNRENGQKPIKVTLYRKVGNGAAEKVDTAELNSGNNWSYTWENLAVRSNDGTDKVTYYVKEDGENSGKITLNNNRKYSVEYNDSAKGTTLPDSSPYEIKDAEITNSYEPLRGDLEVTKKWSFASDFDAVPSDVYLQLQYKDASGNWQPVPYAELKDVAGTNYKYYAVTDSNGKLISWKDAGKAYTTTAYENNYMGANQWICTDSSKSWKFTWENLPVYQKITSGNTVSTRKMEYRVIEGIATKDNNGVVTSVRALNAGDKLNGFIVAYPTYNASNNSGVSFANTPVKLSEEVINTLETGKLTVKKQWVGDSGLENEVRPNSVIFQIEYRKFSNNTPGAWQKLPANIAGVDYATDSTKTFVEVTGTSWEKAISGLPVKDANGNPYEYRITEDSIVYGTTKVKPRTENGKNLIGPYEITSSVSQIKDLVLGNTIVTASNKLLLAKYEAEKNWSDNDNRDGARPGSVDVKLMRAVGNGNPTAYGNTRTLDDSNSWTTTWEKLPVYNNQGTKYSYSLYEDGEAGGKIKFNGKEYSVDYTDAKTLTPDSLATGAVTNTHVPQVITVTAKKNWDDNNNAWNARPSTVTFHLEYSTDGTNWYTLPDGNVKRYSDLTKLLDNNLFDESTVYMVNNESKQTVKQTIDSDGTATWSNLTAYVRDSSGTHTVQYRVVEDNIDSNYTLSGYSADYVSIDTSSTEIVATNKAIPGYLELIIYWDDIYDYYGLRPNDVTVQLYWSNPDDNGDDISIGDPVQVEPVEPVGPGEYEEQEGWWPYPSDELPFPSEEWGEWPEGWEPREKELWKTSWYDIPLKNSDGTDAYYYAVQSIPPAYSTYYHQDPPRTPLLVTAAPVNPNNSGNSGNTNNPNSGTGGSGGSSDPQGQNMRSANMFRTKALMLLANPSGRAAPGKAKNLPTKPSFPRVRSNVLQTVNTISLTPVDLALGPRKNISLLPNGVAPTSTKDFTFTIIPSVTIPTSPYTPTSPSSSVIVKGANAGSFGNIHFTNTGKYYYDIQETVPPSYTAGTDYFGYTFDPNIYTVEVDVTADTNGILSAKVSLVSINGNPTSPPISNPITTTKVNNNDVYLVDLTNNFTPVPTELDFPVEKLITGNPRPASPTTDFQFQLIPITTNAPMPTNVTTKVTDNGSSNVYNCSFDKITYTEPTPANQPWEYKVVESNNGVTGFTYSQSEYTVRVYVTLGSDGKLTASYEVRKDKDDKGNAIPNPTFSSTEKLSFTNEYHPTPITLTPEVEKKFAGQNRKGNLQKFTFTLSPDPTSPDTPPMPTVAGGDTVILTDTSGLLSTVLSGQFGQITFTSAGTYKYTVNEVNTGATGYTYDTAVYTIEVTVTDVNRALQQSFVIKDAKGNILTNTTTGTNIDIVPFTNTYNPVPLNLSLSGTKTLRNMFLRPNMFYFNLKGPDENGNNLNMVASNNAGGVFTFSPITYTRPGVYTYTITEMIGSLYKTTYDTSVYTVTVTVNDKNGTLTPDLKITRTLNGVTTSVNSIEFVNIYHPDVPKTGYGPSNNGLLYSLFALSLVTLISALMSKPKRKRKN